MPNFGIDDTEALRRAYEVQGLSVAAIAETAGCSQADVRRALLAAGVEMRRSEQQTGSRATSKPSLLDDRAFLDYAYVTQGRSARNIAEEVGCTKDAVLLALRSHGIPVRTRAPRQLSGDRPPDVSTTARRATGHSGAVLWRDTAGPMDAGSTTPEPGAAVADPEPSSGDAPPEPEVLAARDRPPDVQPPESAIAEAADALGSVFAPRDERRQEPPPAPKRSPSSQPAASLPLGAADMDLEEIEARAFPVVRRGYDRAEVDAFLRTVAREHRAVLERARRATESAQRAMKEAAAQRAAAEQAAAAQPAAPPADQFFDDVGGRVAAVLNSAAEAAEGIKAEAQVDAAALLQRAYDETEQMRRDAASQLTEAERMRNEVEDEAARVVASARSEAAALVAAARERADQIEHEAQQRVAALERTTRANVEAVVAEARREYEHLRTAQQQCIDRLASVEFLAKHARDGLSDSFMQAFDERLERTS